MHMDAQMVRSQILSLLDKSREVIMPLHCYGGAVGTEATKGLSISQRASDGLPGGIMHLIYMCAFMLQVGGSVGGASLPRPDPDPVELDEATGTTFLCQPPTQLFYADVEPERARTMEALLVRQSAAAMTDTITYTAWEHIPTTYLRTQYDQVLFPDWQKRQIKAVKDTGTHINLESFEASHSPFLSTPEQVVAAVEKVAK